MASGTPVLTTCLPGMPKEYNDYVFLLQDETTEGVKKALQEIFAMTDLELYEKGEKAKAFVLNQKNNEYLFWRKRFQSAFLADGRV